MQSKANCRVVFLSVLVLLSVQAFGENLSNGEFHFSLNVPTDWKEISKEEIHSHPVMTEGFVTGAKLPGTLTPFFTVGVEKTSGQDMGLLLTGMREAAERKGLTVFNLQYDTGKQAYIMIAKAQLT